MHYLNIWIIKYNKKFYFLYSKDISKFLIIY